MRPVCAYCGREPSDRATCDGCGAPATYSAPVLLVSLQGIRPEDIRMCPGEIVKFAPDHRPTWAGVASRFMQGAP